MSQPTTPETQAETTPAASQRRAYTAPRLVVHGTVQTLTQDTSGIDGASGVDTR